MNTTTLRFSFCIILFAIGFPYAAPADIASAWLDTLPPVVSIAPAQSWQAKVVLVSIKASEPAAVYYGINSVKKMQAYVQPFPLVSEGRTVVYYYAEDYIGNRSMVDSMAYYLDTQIPKLIVRPDGGKFRATVTVHLSSNEQAIYLMRKAGRDSADIRIADSIVVGDALRASIVAVDRAGNRSKPQNVSYFVDTTSIRIKIEPRGGLYNKMQKVTLTSPPQSRIFYSLDQLAPPEWFKPYIAPVEIPAGISVLRYFAQDDFGWKSEMGKTDYVIDTIIPRLRLNVSEGALTDTLTILCRKTAVIRYTLGDKWPSDEAPVYERPLIIPHVGRAFVRAVAKDAAGNRSEVLEWKKLYDKIPPVVSAGPAGGTFGRPFKVSLTTNEPANIFYTLDGSVPTQRSTYYNAPIPVSREGDTRISFIAIDEAENISTPKVVEYRIDTKPPVVTPSIEGTIDERAFKVTLATDEPATIYYEIGEKLPTASSRVYKDFITMRPAEVLNYICIDRFGNRTDVKIMDELKRPMVSVSIVGGMYNRPLPLMFISNINADIYYRISPDTVFHVFKDSVKRQTEGPFSCDYYSETKAGFRSPVRREEYLIDFTPPQVDVRIKKSTGDSAVVFFECSENATIYFTLDGSDPLNSKSTRIAGNKYLLYTDRIGIHRDRDSKLTFFAEDIAANRSPLAVIDIFKPRVIPDVQAGADRWYDKILSVNFTTLDKSTIFYARHGHIPTTDSSRYTGPIILLASDTLCAFVIDEAGFHGDIDTFIYNIDLPPNVQFTVLSDTIYTGTPVGFDASATNDPETPSGQLFFKWDLNSDSTIDLEYRTDPRIVTRFPAPGLFQVTLYVRDSRMRIGRYSQQIWVQKHCPTGMVSVRTMEGATYCIDRYEWPNIAGTLPRANVSWIEATMLCKGAQKRLCSAREWKNACSGLDAGNIYPYGTEFIKNQCPVDGKKAFLSGSFVRCSSFFGSEDMLGNVWEWVDDREGTFPLMMGGSYLYGANATCSLTSKGNFNTKAMDTGFRCCR